MSTTTGHDSLFNLGREMMLSNWGKTEFSLDRLKECFPPHKLITLLNNFRYQYFEGMMMNNGCYKVFNRTLQEDEDYDDVEKEYSSFLEYYWLVKHVSKQDPLVSDMVSVHEKWNRDYLDSLVIFPQQFISKYGEMTREFVELFFDFYIYWGYYRDFEKAEEIGLRIVDLLKQVKDFSEVRKKEEEQQDETQNPEDNENIETEEDNEQPIVEEKDQDEVGSEDEQQYTTNEKENGEDDNDDYSYLFEEPFDIEKFYNFLYPKYYGIACIRILDLTFKLNEYEDMSEKLSVLVYEGLGLMFSHVNDTEKAFTYFSKINACGFLGESFIRAHLLNNIGRFEEAYELIKSLTKEENFYHYISEYAYTLGMSNRIEELIEVLKVVLQDTLHPLYDKIKWIHSILYCPPSTEKIANQFKCHGRFVFNSPEIVYATICNSFGTYYHSPFIVESGSEMLCDNDYYKSNPFTIDSENFSIHIPMTMSVSEIYRNITIDVNIGIDNITYKFDNNPHLEDVKKNNLIQFVSNFKSEELRVLKYRNILVSDNITKPFYLSLENGNINTYFYENNIILSYGDGNVKVLSMRNGETIFQGQTSISSFLDDLEECSINHKLMFALTNNNDLVVFPQSGIPKIVSNLKLLCYSGIYDKLMIDEKDHSVSYCYGYETVDGKYVMCEALFDIHDGSILKKNNLNCPSLNLNAIELVIFMEECKVLVFSHENKAYFYNIETHQIIHELEYPVLTEFRVHSKYRDLVLIHPRYEKEAFIFKVETNPHEKSQTVKRLISIPVEDFIVRAKFCGDESIVVLMGNCALVEYDLRSGKLLGMFSFAATYGNVITFVKHAPSKRRFLLYGDEMGSVYILELYKFE